MPILTLSTYVFPGSSEVIKQHAEKHIPQTLSTSASQSSLEFIKHLNPPEEHTASFATLPGELLSHIMARLSSLKEKYPSLAERQWKIEPSQQPLQQWKWKIETLDRPLQGSEWKTEMQYFQSTKL